MGVTPSKDPLNKWQIKNPGQDFLQFVGPGGNVLSWVDAQAVIQGATSQTARVSTTINPGLSVVDLLWTNPFPDNTYFVTFPNPPFAPGAVAPIPPPNTQTDAFTGSLSPNWTAQYGMFEISSAKLAVESVDSGNNRASMYYTNANWAANQYSQVEITATDTSAGLGPIVMGADGAFYGFYIQNGIAYLFKQIVDVTTVFISTAATLNVDDVLYLQLSGQTLVAQQNGTTILTAIDTVPLPLGAPGVTSFPGTSNLRANNWQGGNLQVPVVNIPVILGPWIYLPNGTGIEMTVQNANTTALQVQIDAIGRQA